MGKTLLVTGPPLETSPALPSSTLLLTGGSSLTYYVEAAFGSNPGASSYTWTDITSYVKQIQYTRGRNAQLNQIQAATSTVTVFNLDRSFEPGYHGSQFYPYVVPLVPIRCRLVIESTSYTLFQHFVTSWPVTRTGPSYSEAQIQATDGFEMLTNSLLPGASYPQELSGSRIGRVLDAVSWSTSLRNLSPGNTNAQSYTFADTDQVNALTHIQDIEALEAGLFFIAGNGDATFLDRNTINASPYSISQLTISDDSADVTGGTADLTYSQATPVYDKTIIANDWQVNPASNASYPSLVLQEALDSTSEAEYFPRTQQITVPFISNTDGLALAQYLVLQYRQPILRHDTITITPGRNLTAWTQLATREIGDRITVLAHPPGGGTPYDADERIQWINVTIPQDAANTSLQWGTYPGTIGTFLTLDDSTLGVLDSTNAWGF